MPRLAVQSVSLMTVFATALLLFASGIRAQLNSNQYGLAVSQGSGELHAFPNAAILHSAAGISPVSLPSRGVSVEELVADISLRQGPALSTIESLPPQKALAGLDVDDARSALVVVEDSEKTVHLVLGVFSDLGEHYCQVLSGNRAPVLVAESQFDSVPMKKAWRFNRHESGGISLEFGLARLRIDKLFANFGIVRPNQTVATEFDLTNVGESDILILGKPETSCGCTVADFGKSPILRTGATLPLRVKLATRKGNIRYVITMLLQDSQTEEKFPLELEVLGSQLASMAIVPGRLDFGHLSGGARVKRTMRLSEVTTDRFKIESVDVGTLPLEYELTEKQNADGLNDYHLYLTLSTSKLAAGTHTDVITINTDSRLLPVVNVPVKFHIPADVEVRPRIIAFGVIPSNTPLERIVMLKAPQINDRCAVQFGKLPNDVSTEILSVGQGTCEIQVRLAANKRGPIRESFDVTLLAGDWSETITLEYSAFGEAPKEVEESL